MSQRSQPNKVAQLVNLFFMSWTCFLLGLTTSFKIKIQDMNGGAWQATVHGVTELDTTEQLHYLSFTGYKHLHFIS